MKAFFTKHPLEGTEKIAISMIHKKVESAEEKCYEKDDTYISDLAKAYEMLCDYFEEKQIDPSQYL